MDCKEWSEAICKDQITNFDSTTDNYQTIASYVHTFDLVAGCIEIVAARNPTEEAIGLKGIVCHNYYSFLGCKSCYLNLVGYIINHIFKLIANYFILLKSYLECHNGDIARVVVKIKLLEMLKQIYFYLHRNCFAFNRTN